MSQGTFDEHGTIEPAQVESTLLTLERPLAS